MKRILLLAALFAAVAASAQVPLGKGGKGGTLTGSVETNTIYYVEDDAIVGTSQQRDYEHSVGTHTYIKLDYTWKGLSVGAQADAYLPAMRGYDLFDYGKGEYEVMLGAAYIKWQDDRYSVMGGTVLDQFGSGLIFRSWEDRALGFNNALLGGEFEYNFWDYAKVKVMGGKPRLYFDWTSSWIAGGDLSLSLADMCKMNSVALSLEGSYVMRYQPWETLGWARDFGLNTDLLNMYSARLNFDWNGLSLRGEYVDKSDDISRDVIEPARGNAWLAEVGYSYEGFSFQGTFRRLENMATYLTIDDAAIGPFTGGLGGGNVMNYMPAMTRQYTYMLANLNPYVVQPEGEIGAQADFYYTLRSTKTRAKYWNFHLNFSTYYTLENAKGNHDFLWRDINVDVERQWNRKFKTSLLYSHQESAIIHGAPAIGEKFVSNIFVGDLTYKFDRKKSLRAELQYLWSDDYEGDWVAALVEFNLAPKWSFFVSDMYNLEATTEGINSGTAKNHFYNAGASFTHKQTRVALSYGRNRAGFVCSGGVCRYQPAYTGLNFVLTSSF